MTTRTVNRLIRWALTAGLLVVVWWQAPWSVALCLSLLVIRCELVDAATISVVRPLLGGSR